MSTTEELTISLSAEQAAFIDSLVASGQYASTSEAIAGCISSVEQEKAFLDQWLREEAVPVYDEMRAHPERGIPAEEVFAKLNARLASQQKQKKH